MPGDPVNLELVKNAVESVEEYDATTVVPPDWSAHLDPHGNIRLSLA